METPRPDPLSQEERAKVYELATSWKDSPDIMFGLYYWAGQLKDVQVMPKGRGKFWNQLKLSLSTVRFLLKGVEPNRLIKIYNIVQE